MAKVVTERPRYRTRHAQDESQKTGGRIKVEEFPVDYDDDTHFDLDDCWRNDLPTRQPISRFRQFNHYAKSASIHFSPLIRYLHKQVGRPWDDVYSDLSCILDRRNLCNQVMWKYIFWEVERYPILRNGQVFENRHWTRRSTPYTPLTGLFIHPTTGLLCKSSYVQPRYAAKPDPNLTKLDDLRELVRIDGIWYLQTYHIVKTRTLSYSRCTTCPSTSVLFRQYLYSPISHKLLTGHDWVGRITAKIKEDRKLLPKRQLNHKELIKYGKSNSSLPPVAPSRRRHRRLNLS